LIVLVLAWTLSWVCRDVGTAEYLVEISKPFLQAQWVPAVVFVLAGLIALSTGTSWGTMAILMPVAASLGYHAGGMAVMIPSMAAVLDGAIFGDHCSPISDTTILSSACSGCDHLEHVRTQMPYALAGAVAAGTGGYVLVNALGYPLWTGYFAITVLIGLFVMGLGKIPQPFPRADSDT
jgi:Na+/H+ antiporter NhaC